jgi:hypothetical protein
LLAFAAAPYIYDISTLRVKGTVLLDNNTNLCVTVHGLYWHEYATPERSLVVVVGVVGRERKDRTEIELHQGQSVSLHTHSLSLHQIAHSYLQCLTTFVLKGCKNRIALKELSASIELKIQFFMR